MTVTPPLDLIRQKQILRRRMIKARAKMAARNGAAAGRMADCFVSLFKNLSGVVVSTYQARTSEINPQDLNLKLNAVGAQVALPVVTGRDLPLTFRLYRPGDRLVPGPMDIPEPAIEAPSVTPAVLLVPLLAFDNRGHRLGYGGGYYDRTLKQLRQQGRIIAIGAAFAGQEVDQVPVAPGDEILDFIATDAGLVQPIAF